MHTILSRLFYGILLLGGLCFSNNALATHVYGGDLGYTHIIGNTYKITVAVYGNCAGSAFSSLNGSSASVQVYNGASLITTLTLPQDAPPVEVSPVCPAQANLTACWITSSTIPGVKKFSYSINYTLSGPSADWRFRYTLSARSNDISNITTPGSTSITLDATLNNVGGPNSTPLYTTIPTPFFCVNKPAAYNPGTVDPDGDALTFGLVPGQNGNVPVTYVTTPLYTATNPLSSVPGTFTYSAANGQLDFTPNMTQRSLVVSKVYEYRGSTLVGTSMREMTFVVLPCLNNPPGGSVTTPSTGVTQINGTQVSVCQEQGLFNFNINPIDADGNNINVTVAGLPTGSTFNITNNNTTTPQCVFSWDVSTVAPGNYTFFVTYLDNGCPLASKQTVAYTVTVLPNPTLLFTLISPAICNSKAVFTVTPVNASGPYIINFGSTTLTGVTGTQTDSMAAGTYTFSVSAPNGCTHDTVITLPTTLLTLISADVKQNTCNATTNGQVTLGASNSVPPYTFAMGAGTFSTTPTFTGLATGGHVFHVKDQTGCIRDTTIVVNDSLRVSGNITVTDVACNGGNTGAILVTGYGGVSPYVYALGTGTFATANNFPTLTQGTYPVHIKDNLGCFNDTTALIVEPTVLGISATVTGISCFGKTDGSIVAAGLNGTPGYTYALGTGAFGATGSFTGLGTGSYIIHLKDANNCLKDTTITIAPVPEIGVSLAVNNVLCNGGVGSITVTATNGIVPYLYAGNTGVFSTSNVLGGLAPGTHAVHIKDANGCLKDTMALITQPAVLGIAVTKTDPLCFGGSTGTITITGNGGTTAYSYALDANPFVASGAMTGVADGTYVVHLQDANGCTKDTTVTLIQPTAITVSALVKRPRCTPLVNGIVTLTAAGGTPGYTYARGTGTYQTSATFNGLGSGTYTFHVKDNNNCIKDTTIVLTDSVFIHASTLISNVKCINGSDGAINVTPNGGDLPYTYAINTAAYVATNPIINLIAGTYTLHIKDDNGCVLDTLQTITQPTMIVPGVTITQPLCYNGSDGTITVSASGGTPGYTYAIGAGTYSATPNFTGLAAGTHTLHIRDINNCPHDTVVTMGQPTEMIYTFISMTHLICNGDSSGTVTVRALGGTPAYSYAAESNPFQASHILTGLKAGMLAIHLKDANGCIRDTTVQLFEPTKVHVQIPSIITPTCEGYADGSVVVLATGGNPGYTYSQTGTAYDTQRHYYRLVEGSYTFHTKDSRGCLADTTIALVGYPHINLNTPTITDASCNGYVDGKFQLNVSGGNPPFKYYMKSPADTNATGYFDSLKKGIYAIHIVDDKGCFKDMTVTINHPDTLIASTLITPNDCSGYDDGGAVEVKAMGGTTPYNYLWSTTPRLTTDRITGLPNGKYAVIVSDAHNCADTTIAIVPYDNCCKPYIADAFTPNGDGRNDRFHVMFKGDVKLESFSIYNRFGQRVFYTTSADVGWDGTWNDRNQDVGTYFYYIKLICGNKGDNVQEYKGDVTLIR